MMLIGYSSKATVSVTPALGPFASSTEDGLIDGFPTRVARLFWFIFETDITQSMTIQLSFSFPVPNRIAVVRGITLPVGTLLRVALRNAADVVIATVDQRVVQFTDGSRGAWFVFPEGTANSKYADLLIFDDVNGSTSGLSSGEVFDIGEFAVMPCVVVANSADWSDEFVDPTEATLSRDSQPATVVRTGYRKIEASVSASSYEQCYGGGLEGGMDLVQLREAFAGDRRAIAIPRWHPGTGILSQALVNATAIYCTVRMGRVQHLGGDYYSVPITFTEVPTQE